MGILPVCALSPCRVVVVVVIMVMERPVDNTHLFLHGGHKDPTPAWLEEACHERLRHARTSSRRVKKNREMTKKNHRQQSLSKSPKPHTHWRVQVVQDTPIQFLLYKVELN